MDSSDCQVNVHDGGGRQETDTKRVLWGRLTLLPSSESPSLEKQKASKDLADSLRLPFIAMKET